MNKFPVSIVIDPDAGFCSGVRAAVRKAEQLLDNHTNVYCLGNLVHNEQEVVRLKKLGLETINIQEIDNLTENSPLIIRAHGEPPETYSEINKRTNELSDATCAIVQQLQRKVKSVVDQLAEKEGRIIIYGKPGHPEIIGLLGQADGKASVVQHADEVPDEWLNETLEIFAQTTANARGYKLFTETLVQRVEQRSGFHNHVHIHQTICRQMKNREPAVAAFARTYDVVVFVSGSESSNGRFLAGIALQANSRTHVVTSDSEIDKSWFIEAQTIGVSGATSTPQWLLQQVAEQIRQLTH